MSDRRQRAVPVPTPLGEQHYDRGAELPRVRVIHVPADADTIERLIEVLRAMLHRPGDER